MPRIDPLQLLTCLSVLLEPSGGIKSRDEVNRLASLMTKFSKKLVSKCIYISILKKTDTELLIMFMSAGGWDLSFHWLQDGVQDCNWPLVNELVGLLLLCPVNIDRLKTNNCPKLIKTLSKDYSAAENVRLLAVQLVEKWLRIVKGITEPMLPPEPLSQQRIDESVVEDENVIEEIELSSEEVIDNGSSEASSVASAQLPVLKITMKDGKQVLSEVMNSSERLQESDPVLEEKEQSNEESDEEIIKPVVKNRKKLLSRTKRQPLAGRKKNVNVQSRKAKSAEQYKIDSDGSHSGSGSDSDSDVSNSSGELFKGGKQIKRRGAIKVGPKNLKRDLNKLKDISPSPLKDRSPRNKKISKKTLNKNTNRAKSKAKEMDLQQDKPSMVKNKAIVTNVQPEKSIGGGKGKAVELEKPIINSENVKDIQPEKSIPGGVKGKVIQPEKLSIDIEKLKESQPDKMVPVVGKGKIILPEKTVAFSGKDKDVGISKGGPPEKSVTGAGKSKTVPPEKPITGNDKGKDTESDNTNSVGAKASPKERDITVEKYPSGTKSKPKEDKSLASESLKRFSALKDKMKEREQKRQALQKEYLDRDLSEKDKSTLAKLITPSISKLGKIPKKVNVETVHKKEKESELKTGKESEKKEKDVKRISKVVEKIGKGFENKDKDSEQKDKIKDLKKNQEGKKPVDIKRPPLDPKKYNISIEKRSLASEERPKTVKTFNSKFRSTGLEEEIKPISRQPIKKSSLPLDPEKKATKRSSPLRDSQPAEKKLKAETAEELQKLEKPGGVKLIPAKPKPMFLQESDVFMDALTAANLLKEPRKRKRRTSGSKDGTGPPEPKKELTSPNANSTPPSSPLTDEKISPTNLKPSFKFYQETLDTSVDPESDSKDDSKNNHKLKKEVKTEDEDEKEENLEFAEPRTAEDNEDSSNSTNDDAMTAGAESYENRQRMPQGVLVYTKTRREPKKRVSWKMDDELEAVRFFDLDETERVNVTKTFTDMKQMERSNEREQMLIARKLPTHDIMEERTQWRLLIPIDIPPKGQVITPGKNSHEKDIQYAREKTVLQAIYFNKRLIPDSAAEPDLEIHATTDPTLIPLDDTSGNGDSINDFTTLPWPESRYAPEPLIGPGPPQSGFHSMSGGPIHPVPFQPPQPYAPGPYPYPPLPPNQPPANWTNGVQPEMFPMGGMMPAGPMPPRSLLGLPATDMGFHPPMGVGGPSDGPPFMYGPTPSPAMYNQPPRFQGPWFGTPQGHGHLGEGNRGGNRGGYGHWRGGGHDSSQRNSSWGSNSNRRVCKNVINKGFCRTSNCPFQHPKDS